MNTKGAVEPRWCLVDAGGKTLGRLATRIATVLQGKHRATYVPHMDTGDYVVVINAEKVVMTGKKLDQKVYRHHTGYIGHLVETSAREMMEEKPEEILRRAVKRMLPKSKLGRKMFDKLKVYSGTEHPHAAQKPEVLEI
jgi:large subunit ribosomal protein L13